MTGGGGHIQSMITSLRNNRLMRHHSRFADRFAQAPHASSPPSTRQKKKTSPSPWPPRYAYTPKLGLRRILIIAALIFGPVLLIWIFS
ncbi:MAG: hypothetical protein GXO24_07310 [Chlorobi bacterium]|nr:hypothetical protein [Chlorobiota bacterium]